MIGLATKHVLCVVLVAAVIVADVDSRNFNDGAADRGLLRKEGKPKEKGKNKKRKGSGPLRREERPPFLEGPSELEQPGNPSNAPPGDPRPDKPRNPPSPPSKSDDSNNDDDDDDSDNGGFNFFDFFDRPRFPSTGGPSTSTSPFQGRRRSGNISSDLREAVRSGDFNRVAALLNENNDVSGLAKGFTFSPQDRGIDLARTPERLRDGDVVTMKGIAKSALDTGQARKLARIVAKSIFPGDPFSRAPLADAMTLVFSNPVLMTNIVEANPSYQLLPLSGRRRLTCDSCSPVNSWVCASCWARDACSPMFWCS